MVRFHPPPPSHLCLFSDTIEMMKKDQKGFSAVEGLLIIVVVSIIGFVGWYVVNKHKAAVNTTQATQTISTAGWKTYKNDTLKFTVHYPSSYKLIVLNFENDTLPPVSLESKSKKEKTVDLSPQLQSFTLVNRSNISFYKVKNTSDEIYTVLSQDHERNDVIIDGVKCVRFTKYIKNNDYTTRDIRLFVPQVELVVEVFDVYDSTAPELVTISDKILQSLEFI